MAVRKTSGTSSRAAPRPKAKPKARPKSQAEAAGSPPAPAPPAKPPSAAKSIILFSDGTGNHSGKLFKTNVWRLYEALDLGPPAGERQRQIAYYDNGVGTSGFKPIAMLGGVFGLGLKRNVLEIYRYACRNYDPDSVPAKGSQVTEKGDHIYGFGFSRGAFTMRLVIGLIADQGLVPYSDESDLERKTNAAWRAFRRTSRRRALRWIRNLFVRAAPQSIDEAAAQEKSLAAAEQRERAAESKHYDSSDNYQPVIRMIGVWDTVAAYGGPFAEITRAIDNWIYPLSMPNYALHPRIRCARHALALDDERDSFWPLLWDEVAEAHILGKKVDGKDAPWLNKDRLKQVWFAGMHADVGGGYPDESLSYVSLLWMIGGAHQCGLRTVDEITDRYFALANSFGPIHDSRGGLGSYYRYQPRKIAAFIAANRDDHDVTSTLSLRDPQVGTNRDEKGLLAKVVVHESVVARIATGTDGYAPIVLPHDYRVEPARGEVTETKPLPNTGGDPYEKDPGAGTRTPLLPDHIRNWLTPAAMERTAQAMESPWDYVLFRRLFYFLTVIATVALFTMPWWIISLFQRDSGDLQLALDGRNLIGNVIRLPGELLPETLQRWTDTWASNSIIFLGLVGAIALFRNLGSRMQARIRDRAREIWHSCVPRIPPATAATDPAARAPHRPSWVEKWRTHPAYQRGVQLMKWAILPNAVFAPLLAALLAIMMLGVTTQASLPWVERSQNLCPSGDARDLGPGKRFDFRTDALCNQTGIRVEAGQKYLITIEIDEDWYDGTYRTDARGLSAGDMRLTLGYWGMPLRRVLDARYLQPLAGVRVRDEDQRIFSRLLGSMTIRPLEMTAVEAEPNRFTVEFEAPAGGELVLFANDSVWLLDPGYFYRNNRGTACVTVTPARPVQGELGEGGRICRSLVAKDPEAPAATPTGPPAP